jgi:hypothetical protein
VHDEAQRHDTHHALRSEYHREDNLNLFEELVGGICISVGQGRVDGQRDARPQDGEQDKDLEPFCFGYLNEKLSYRIFQ